MRRYCEQCRDFHEENDLCPKYKELLKQHPEWFNEMMQTMVTATISTSTVQRYGAAIKEHLVAYDGIDHERGTVASRSLKSVAQSKVNPNDSVRNIKQQAGFSAEIKSAARANADRIINGDDTTRTTRTDDMSSQSDGRGGSIGGTNDQFYDVAEVDKNGVYVEGSGRQLKFVGNDAESCTKSLLQKDYDKYRKHAKNVMQITNCEGVSKKSRSRESTLYFSKEMADIELSGKQWGCAFLHSDFYLEHNLNTDERITPWIKDYEARVISETE